MHSNFIQNHETYELLEFLGDGVLQFCTHEILMRNSGKSFSQSVGKRLNSFVSNENLAKLAKEIGIDELVITTSTLNEKRYADMLEALIGAIYINGGIDGIDDVCKFLGDNFGDEILGFEC